METNKNYWILIFSLASLVTSHNYFEYYNNFYNKINLFDLFLEELFLFIFSILYFYFFIQILKKNYTKNILIIKIIIVIILIWLSYLIVNIFSELIFNETIKFFVFKAFNIIYFSKDIQKITIYLFPFIFSPLIYFYIKDYFKYLSFIGILGFFFLILAFYNSLIFNLDIISNNKSFNTKFNVEKQKTINSKRKLLWIVFDELDPKIYKKVSIFTNNFEKLRTKSFYHENVFSPAKESIDSMPSIIMGLQTSGKIISNKKFYLINNNKKYHLNFSNTIFGNLKNLGINVSIFSSAIEYCSAYLKSDNYYICKDRNIVGEIKNLSTDSDGFNFRQYLNGIINQYGLNKLFFLKNIFKNTKKKDKLTDSNQLNNSTNTNFDENLEDDVDGCGAIKYSDLLEVLGLNNSFTLAHVSLPHLYFDCADELVTNYFKNKKDFNDIKKYLNANFETDYKYLRNIIYIDYIIKKLLLTIKENKLDENLMLVISSDHWLRNQNIDKSIFDDVSQSFLMIKIFGNDNLVLNNKKNSLLALPYLFLNFFNEKIFDHNDIDTFFNENNFFEKVYIK